MGFLGDERRKQLETLGFGMMCAVNLGHEDGMVCIIGSHWMSVVQRAGGGEGNQNDSLDHFNRAVP